MADFTKLAATAKRLIEKNGRTVTVQQQAVTAADASMPWRATPTPAAVSVTGKAVFVDSASLGITYVNEDNVKRGVQVALFAASNDGNNELEAFDTIEDGTRTWKITNAEVLQPADTRLLYMFEVAQ